jgi:hypothetical protein
MIQVSREQLEKRGDEAPPEIQDAVFADANNELLAQIGKANSLSEKQEWELARVCLYAFLGFISTKDVFEELKALLGGNAKAAYDAYVQIDQNLFDPVRAQINHMRRVSGIKDQGSEETQTVQTERRVDLRMQAKPGDVNLREVKVESEKLKEEPSSAQAMEGAKPMMMGTEKREIPDFEFPISKQVQNQNTQVPNTEILHLPAQADVVQNDKASYPISETRPPISGQQLFSPHNFHMRTSPPLQAPENKQEAKGEQKTVPLQPIAPQPLQQQTIPSPQPVEEGPVILHSKEEAVPIAQAHKRGEYKSMSAGGFLGSFGSVFGRKKEESSQAPRADVQIPSLNYEEENVPMKVKNFGE